MNEPDQSAKEAAGKHWKLTLIKGNPGAADWGEIDFGGGRKRKLLWRDAKSVFHAHSDALRPLREENEFHRSGELYKQFKDLQSSLATAQEELKRLNPANWTVVQGGEWTLAETAEMYRRKVLENEAQAQELAELRKDKARQATSHCVKHNTFPADDEPCWQCIVEHIPALTKQETP